MHKERTGSLKGFPAAEEITPEELLSLECEILIPAALENTITEENAHTIRTRDRGRSGQRAGDAGGGPHSGCRRASS